MSDGFPTFVIGFGVGVFVFLVFVAIASELNGPRLRVAQADYTECLRLGAPPDNCLKEFLLPKEGNDADR